MIEKHIKPENCAFAIALPSTEKEFETDLAVINKDFSSIMLKRAQNNQERAIQIYNKEIIHFIDKVCPELEQMGVNVAQKVTFPEFNLFYTKRFDVIVLFSHGIRDKKNNKFYIEFYDGLVEMNEFVNHVPSCFNGLIALTMRTPKNLVTKSRKRNDRYTLQFSHKNLMPSMWLLFYRDLFRYLQRHHCTYYEAFEIISSQYYKWTKRREQEIIYLRDLASTIKKFIKQFAMANK